MKTKLLSMFGLCAVVLVLAFVACQNPADLDDPGIEDDPEQEITTGSITGKAVFTNSTNHEGITITLEETDGLRSLAVIDVNRGITARAVVDATRTGTDGSFTLSNIPAGLYTLYASSQDSLEKAVTQNITVKANVIFDAGTLNLTPVGNIAGKIIVDNGAGNAMGFLVSIAGTSFMATTDSNGEFIISGIPAGSGYALIVMKGNYTTLYYEDRTVSVSGGVTTPLDPKEIAGADLQKDTEITIGEDGYWYINGESTGIPVQGSEGSPGEESAYTVSFYANDATNGTAPVAQTVSRGYTITLPSGSGFSRTGFTFGGWNTLEDGTGITLGAGTFLTVTGNVALYAQWYIPNVVPGETLATKLTWLETNALSGMEYIIEVNANANINPTTLSYSGRDNITVTLRGADATRTISLSSNGSMFEVGSGVTLVLDNNITLQGRSDNNTSLIVVNSGGSLLMKAGAKITGNIITSSYGGGVYNDGTFTMSGGEISGNITTTSSFSYSGGGGVYNDGIFTMSGGEIFGNISSSGGGVYNNSGTFTMEGGEISGNTGGGVYNGGTFTMSDGEISGNTGGGVYNHYSGTFTMSDGEISGNTGHGVDNSQGTFTMAGGKISGNTASSGGGVYTTFGTFTMAGGEISGNIASSGGGGGVYIGGTTFTKSGGTIYGYDAANAGNSLWNKVIDSSGLLVDNQGHAVYVYGSPEKRRETTAEPTVNLNSSVSGAAGGWEN